MTRFTTTTKKGEIMEDRDLMKETIALAGDAIVKLLDDNSDGIQQAMDLAGEPIVSVAINLRVEQADKGLNIYQVKMSYVKERKQETRKGRVSTQAPLFGKEEATS